MMMDGVDDDGQQEEFIIWESLFGMSWEAVVNDSSCRRSSEKRSLLDLGTSNNEVSRLLLF